MNLTFICDLMMEYCGFACFFVCECLMLVGVLIVVDIMVMGGLEVATNRVKIEFWATNFSLQRNMFPYSKNDPFESVKT
jgi:hypothetical protein